ncbi:hypothetical protein [Shewanella subflava]|uniref:Uncharacterized protein n=1 Tax=Shewanella subflava TaxID=2986476 RepID=A0ABT3I6U5_9GAMM|nr:hypothetical protein [Shewanella subflava]MCW3171781.1 hypothetical protein [Shewanella subflava]
MPIKLLPLNTLPTVFVHTLQLGSLFLKKIHQYYQFFAHIGVSQWEVENR